MKYLVTRTVTVIEADTAEDALRQAIDRDAFYSVRGSDLAWATVAPTAAEKRAGQFYPAVIVEPVEHAPWNRD